VQRSFLGQLVSVMPCPECGGEGKRSRAVRACERAGCQRAQREDVEVDVPAGVSTGDYLTLRGQGNAAPRGGARGDVLVVLEVEEDERFIRDGADLIHELPITFSQAALGAELEVPTIGGTRACGSRPARSRASAAAARPGSAAPAGRRTAAT
jgi:molecular chaperone DnaJ